MFYILHFSPSGRPPGGGENCRERGETTGGRRHGEGWGERGEARGDRSEYENRERLWETGGHRGGGMRGGQHFHPHPHFYQNCHDGPQNMNRPPKQSRGRSNHNRGRYQLAQR